MDGKGEEARWIKLRIERQEEEVARQTGAAKHRINMYR